jgi:hypothetical protein
VRLEHLLSGDDQNGKINFACDYFILKYLSRKSKVQSRKSGINPDFKTLKTLQTLDYNKFFDILVFIEKISNLINF